MTSKSRPAIPRAARNASRAKAPAQMKDVAARAGVSITTVSHIINATREVAPDTRDRVLAAMRDLNYYANALGRRLKRGRSDSFGLIISDIENPFFPELIKSYESAVLNAGCDVVLFTTNYNPDQAVKAVRRMIENKVQGVAVMTSQLEPGLVDDLTGAGIPVVRLDAAAPRQGCSNIHVDYSTGARQAAAHLKRLGHRKITFITGPQDRLSAVTYREAFLRALAELGLPAARVFESTNTIEGGSKAAMHILQAGGKMSSALLCGNDLAAIGVMRALSEHGLRVPDDVSVIGADDISYVRYASPPLTTIRVPRDRLGSVAYDALARMLRTKRRTGSDYSLETQLILRNSTAAAKPTRMRLSAQHAGGLVSGEPHVYP